MNFWEVMKEMSADAVRQDARRLFVLGLAGDPESVAAARAKIIGENPTHAQEAAVAPFLYTASPPYTDVDEKWLRNAELVVSLPGGPGPTDFRPADSLRVDDPALIVSKVLAHRSDLRVSLGRRLTGFRDAASEAVIRDVARVNAEFTVFAGISQVVPILLPFFPILAGADLLVLTKNQVLMLFRLAAIYGEEPHIKQRALETVPIVGGSLVWRSLARQIVGAIPGPLALPAKAAIGYSGTYAVGKAAQTWLDEGRKPSRKEMQLIYKEGARLAKEAVAKLRRRKPEEPKVIEEARPSLAAGEVEILGPEERIPETVSAQPPEPASRTSEAE